MIILGIDPGKTGALALVEVDKSRSVVLRAVCPMPLRLVHSKYTVDLDEAEDWVFGNVAVVHRGVVELVSSFKQGRTSAFQFGRMFGGAEAIASSVSFNGQIHYVTPQTWKKKMGLTKDKEDSLAKARKMFPGEGIWNLKKDADIAEAVLLAVYYAKHVIP